VDRIVVDLAGTVSVVAGTATSGATLDNLTGAAGVPNSKLLLADVLVGANVTVITNSVIRDRRKWARGACCRIIRTSNASASDDYTTSSGTLGFIDSVNLQPRIECSGVPLLISLGGIGSHSTDGVNTYMVPQIDSVGVDGSSSIGSGPGSGSSVFAQTVKGANGVWSAHQNWITAPSAGSHLVGMAWASGATASLRARSTAPLLFMVRELLSQNTANNTTTSG
jgi:hypothetical protein